MTVLVIIAVDQLIKIAVIAAKQSLPLQLVPKALAISSIQNTGIALGFFQGSNFLLGMVSAAVAALIILYRNKAKEGVEAAAMSLILGGTLSNLLDRVFRGAVIDYITVWTFPTFNIADAALTAGAALILSAFVVGKLKPRKE